MDRNYSRFFFFFAAPPEIARDDRSTQGAGPLRATSAEADLGDPAPDGSYGRELWATAFHREGRVIEYLG